MLREVRPVQVTSQDLSYKIKAFVSDAWVSPKSKKKKQYQRSSESKIMNRYESLMINKCLS